MKKVLIGILTHNRPSKFYNCLSSILSQELVEDFHYSILVVENNNVKTLEIPKTQNIDIIYELEKQKGPSFGRNRVLKYGKKNNYDYLLFIDDDEIADSDWSNNLISCAEKYKSFAVHGPSFPTNVDNEKLPSDLYCKFPSLRTGTKLKIAATSNVLLNVSKIEDLNFNTIDFNLIGDDFYFFYKASLLKKEMIWCDEARVYEDVDINRLEKNWLEDRYYNNCYITIKVMMNLKNSFYALHFAISRSIKKIILLPLLKKDRHFLFRVKISLIEVYGLISGVFTNKR